VTSLAALTWAGLALVFAVFFGCLTLLFVLLFEIVRKR
jgi:hypothetical protein